MFKLRSLVNAFLLTGGTIAMSLYCAAFAAIAQPLPGQAEQDIFIAPINHGLQASAGQPDAATLCTPGTPLPKALQDRCLRYQMAQIDWQQQQMLAAQTAAQQSQDFAIATQQNALMALRAQHRRSGIIFWLVMVMVLAGSIAAGLQFRQAWHSPSTTPTEITVSDRQLSVKTTWIGVVLLALSMGFLALYLSLVYKLTPVFPLTAP